MMIINVLTARYFEEDGKRVCKWIAECRRKSNKMSEGVTRRWQKGLRNKSSMTDPLLC